MIATAVAASLFAGSALGWYGHKASLRIRYWGMNLNEHDELVRSITGETSGITWRDEKVRAPGILPQQHLPTGATSK